MISYLIDGTLYSLVLNAIVVFVAIYSFYFYSTSTYDKWRKLKVPFARPKPLFGNMLKMVLSMEKQSDTFDRIYRQFPDEKYCGFFQMRMPFLMIRDPELINNILIKDFSHFTDHGMKIDTSSNLLGRSLIFANGQKWRTMRQKLSPGFSSGKIKGTYDQIKECTEQLISKISEKSKIVDRIEVRETFGTFTTDVIGTCAFGLKLNTIANDDSEFRMQTKKMFGTGGLVEVLRVFVGMFFPGLAKLLKLKVFPEEAINFFSNVFRDLVDYRTKNNVVRNDLAQSLLQARKELVLNNDSTGRDKFTDLDIIANAVLFFSAGAEPVSITLTFCLYELAINQDIQEKLRSEINSVKQKHDGKITNDFLNELQYADMVMNETHRKYSLTVSLMRETTQDYNVHGESLIIKKGQILVIPMYSIHNDPKYYPNPSTFDPERFSAEEKSKRPNGTFFPFGEGPRQCIAKRFAEMEIKLVLSEILSKFEILPCEKTEIPLEMRVSPGLTMPKNGLWLRFKPMSE